MRRELEKMNLVPLGQYGRGEKLKKHLQIVGEDECECSSEALNGKKTGACIDAVTYNSNGNGGLYVA